MKRKILNRLKMSKFKKINYQSTLDAFRRFNISYDKLGFWSQPEYRQSQILGMNEYALFVNLQPYSRSYIKRSRRIIQQICSILYKELEKDPDNLGLCVPVSEMLSSILEKEGIWNYQVSGRTRVNFSSDLNLNTIFSNDPPFDDGHSWVVAPPFGVIDITIKHQYYLHNEQEYLPNMIMYEPSNYYDYFDDEFGFFQLPTHCVMHNNNVEVIYIEDTVRGHIKNLSASSNIHNLNGNNLLEIYNTLIRPKLIGL